MNKAVEDAPLMSVRECAAYLRMSLWWTYQAAAKGVLPCLRVGRAVRFRQEEVEHWLDRTRPTTHRLITEESVQEMERSPAQIAG